MLQSFVMFELLMTSPNDDDDDDEMMFMVAIYSLQIELKIRHLGCRVVYY